MHLSTDDRGLRTGDWTLLLDSARPGWANMAIDQALLDLAEEEGRAFLRLYRWAPSCLSFGRNESAAKRYDRGLISELGLDLVRRPTGGRAVWHARELTYAVAAPDDRFGPPHDTYTAIHETLARALHALGAEASLARESRPAAGLGTGACFIQAAGGEVIVKGHKVVGSAQLRQGGALLQHGSILLEDDQSMIASLTLGPASRGLDAPLSSLVGRRVSFEEAAEAVMAAAASWPGEWSGETSNTDWHTVTDSARAHEDWFRSEEWTWRR